MIFRTASEDNKHYPNFIDRKQQSLARGGRVVAEADNFALDDRAKPRSLI